MGFCKSLLAGVVKYVDCVDDLQCSLVQTQLVPTELPKECWCAGKNGWSKSKVAWLGQVPTTATFMMQKGSDQYAGVLVFDKVKMHCCLQRVLLLLRQHTAIAPSQCHSDAVLVLHAKHLSLCSHKRPYSCLIQSGMFWRLQEAPPDIQLQECHRGRGTQSE